MFAEVTNNSADHMSTLRVRLRRTVEFATSTPYMAQLDVSKMDQQVDVSTGQTQQITATLPIPEGIQHSTSNRIISCKYYIVCQGVTDGCCNTNVTAWKPVK